MKHPGYHKDHDLFHRRIWAKGHSLNCTLVESSAVNFMLNYLRRYTRIDYRFVLRTVLISRKPKDTIRLPDICFLGNETYRSPIAPSAPVCVQGQRYLCPELGNAAGPPLRAGAVPPFGRTASPHSISSFTALTRHLPRLCQILPITPIWYVHRFFVWNNT